MARVERQVVERQVVERRARICFRRRDRGKNKLPQRASLTAQSPLLHCHAVDTVRTVSKRNRFSGEL
jgi:hypothetical protein